MTPPPAFVTELRAYDPALRVRWARHRAQAKDKPEPLWMIERKLSERHRQLLAERPVRDDVSRLNPAKHKNARKLDLWEGWRAGYVHIMDVHPSLLEWSKVAPVLAAADAWRQGGMLAIARKYEDEDAQADRAQERHEQRVIDKHLDGAWDHLQWQEKRRVSTYVPEDGGFLVQDRRAVVR